MKIFENVINHKINNMTTEELMKYAKQFQIDVTEEQASKIASYLSGKKFNIFDAEERRQLIREIAKTTDVETAKKVNQLFLLFTK
jgi:CheY-specific phosphatase CheX